MKVYLGDGVYAELDPMNQVKLSTEDGNEVFLDDNTLQSLMQFLIEKKGKESVYEALLEAEDVY